MECRSSSRTRQFSNSPFSTKRPRGRFHDFCTGPICRGLVVRAVMNNRDNFTEKVKQAVAARAGWLCSFSGCGKLTVGPSEEAPEAVAKIGEAAHICAASQGQGARRYDAMMTPDE